MVAPKSKFVINPMKCQLNNLCDELSKVYFTNILRSDDVKVSFKNFIHTISEQVLKNSPSKNCRPGNVLCGFHMS